MKITDIPTGRLEEQLQATINSVGRDNLAVRVLERELDRRRKAPESDETLSDICGLSALAIRLRIPSQTLKALATSGEIPGRRVGSIWLFNQRAVEEALVQILPSAPPSALPAAPAAPPANPGITQMVSETNPESEPRRQGRRPSKPNVEAR